MDTYSIDPVPWQGKQEWQEVVLFFDTIERVHGHGLAPVRILADKIQSLVDSLSDPIEQACRVICPDCNAVCCERATIWYDFKDILYLHAGTTLFPVSQIKRIPARSGHHCMNLTKAGCCLPRNQRPFVCTWYFCPAQKNYCEGSFIPGKIIEIKRLRQQMEDAFCRISAGISLP